MEFVVELPLQPEGKTQVYELAVGTAVTLKVLVVPAHTDASPVIAPGCTGMVITVTAMD
jgi:hypothetical protein